MHPIFHVILAEERLRVYTGSHLLETYISTSNEPWLLNATDLNVCVRLEVLSGITTNNNVCTASTVLYKYMKSLIKYVHNVSDNTHVRRIYIS